MATKRERAGASETAAPPAVTDEEMTPRLADPSGLGRPLVEGEDSAGGRARPDEVARAESRGAPGPGVTPPPRKRKGGAATKASKGARAKRAMGPRGRQLARVGRTERGKGRTAGVRPASRKAVNPKSKAKAVKGSPKARRRKSNRGTRSPARRR